MNALTRRVDVRGEVELGEDAVPRAVWLEEERVHEAGLLRPAVAALVRACRLRRLAAALIRRLWPEGGRERRRGSRSHRASHRGRVWGAVLVEHQGLISA